MFLLHCTLEEEISTLIQSPPSQTHKGKIPCLNRIFISRNLLGITICLLPTVLHCPHNLIPFIYLLSLYLKHI